MIFKIQNFCEKKIRLSTRRWDSKNENLDKKFLILILIINFNNFNFNFLFDFNF